MFEDRTQREHGKTVGQLQCAGMARRKTQDFKLMRHEHRKNKSLTPNREILTLRLTVE